MTCRAWRTKRVSGLLELGGINRQTFFRVKFYLKAVELKTSLEKQ